MAKQQTVLGFDFGLKRIGVAVGQTVTGTASPLDTLKAEAGEPHWEQIAKLIAQWRPDALVVGIPLRIDSSDQHITHEARRFAKSLRSRYGLPVHTVDERFTTLEAKQRLFDVGGYRSLEKAQIDSWAAKLITESWLERNITDEK